MSTSSPDHEQRAQALLTAGLGDSTVQLSGQAWIPPTPSALVDIFPRLEVLELLGQGGMGAVYKARQTHLDRVVALKLLDPRLGRDVAFTERFRREGLALARLSHPHIVSFYDIGEIKGWHYLVMEYVDGANLRQAMRTGSFSPGETLRVVAQLCDALAYAHEQGVVHRDFKPENILIDTSGRVRIADFGLAKMSGETGRENLTRSDQMLGTAAYMAPEQVAKSNGIDHRADLFALGVVIYEMLTGQLPLGRFEPPSHRVNIDVRLDEVVLRALERTPEKRWQTAGDVGRAFSDITAAKVTHPVHAPVQQSRQEKFKWNLSPRLIAWVAILVMCIAAIFWWKENQSASSIQAAPVFFPIQTPPKHSPHQTDASHYPSDAIIQIKPADSSLLETPAQAALTTVVSATGELNTTPKELIKAVEPEVKQSVPLVETAIQSIEQKVLSVTPSVNSEIPPAANLNVSVAAAAIPVVPLTALEIDGEGDVIVTCQEGGRSLAALFEKVPNGIALSHGDAGVLRCHNPGEIVHLTVSPDAFTHLIHRGHGLLSLRHMTGKELNVKVIGVGAMTLTGVKVTHLELHHTSPGAISVDGTCDSVLIQSNVIIKQPSGDLITPTPIIDIRRLFVRDLHVLLSGAAALQLAGNASSLRLRSSGNGSVNATDLNVDAADIELLGFGHVMLGRVKNLNVTCTGNGKITYRGSPHIGRYLTEH